MKDNNLKNKIEQYLDLYTKLWAFSGTVAAIKGGEIIFNKAYGYANIEYKVKNTTDTKFRIWSITKQFTAAAILLLEESGMLKVEDKIKRFFPELTSLNGEITIHHLLTNTSGIFNYTNLPNARKTFEKMDHKKAELLELFASKPLEFEPGTDYSYSNTGYYMLGEIIERVSGRTYEEFLTENIFKPLGMNNTGVDYERRLIENKATGYYLDGNDLIHCKYVNMNLIGPSGGMYSTAEDLLIWDQALNNNKLLSKASIEKMNTAYKNNYGYGVCVEMNGDRRDINHNGACEGYLTEIHRYVDDDFAVVVLSNYGFTAVWKLCSVISSMAFEEKYDMPSKPEVFPLDNETLEKYLGVYEEEGFKLELKKKEAGVDLVIDEEFALPVYPIGENEFHHTWIDESYEITKDDEGQLCIWGVKKNN